jgi:hypothetical protein
MRGQRKWGTFEPEPYTLLGLGLKTLNMLGPRTGAANEHHVVLASHELVEQEGEPHGLDGWHEQRAEGVGVVRERRHPRLPWHHGAGGLVHKVVVHQALRCLDGLMGRAAVTLEVMDTQP